MAEPELYLADHAGELVVLDEIHRSPGLFECELLPDRWRGGDRPGRGNGREWAIEVKRSLAPKLGRGLRSALEDLQPERRFVVYSGEERFPLGSEVEAIGLAELCAELARG